MSLCASPHEFTIMIVSILIFGAIFMASAKAWLGSKLGFKFSYLVTIWYAFKASSSLAAVYLALLVSFKKQWSGEIPG